MGLANHDVWSIKHDGCFSEGRSHYNNEVGTQAGLIQHRLVFHVFSVAEFSHVPKNGNSHRRRIPAKRI
jgi:hypothetical protein